VRVCVCMCVCICVYVCVCVCVCMCVCVCFYTYMQACVYMYTCIYVYEIVLCEVTADAGEGFFEHGLCKIRVDHYQIRHSCKNHATRTHENLRANQKYLKSS
jgi:hypothetical protein